MTPASGSREPDALAIPGSVYELLDALRRADQAMGATPWEVGRHMLRPRGIHKRLEVMRGSGRAEQVGTRLWRITDKGRASLDRERDKPPREPLAGPVTHGRLEPSWLRAGGSGPSSPGPVRQTQLGGISTSPSTPPNYAPSQRTVAGSRAAGGAGQRRAQDAVDGPPTP